MTPAPALYYYCVPTEHAALDLAVLYRHLLGSVGVEHARPRLPGAEALFRTGLTLLVAGIKAYLETA